MSTEDAPRMPGSIDATYTARERLVVTALTGLRCATTADPDVKARARDALMLILTAEHAAAGPSVAHATMAC